MLRVTRATTLSGTPYRPWIVAWVGAAVLAIANGAARERFLAARLGARRANQVSSLSLAGALGAYASAVQRARPIPTAESAVGVGAAWVGMTVAFEMGLGRLQRQSWASLFAAYDVRRGNLWSLLVLWIGALPMLTRLATVKPQAREGH